MNRVRYPKPPNGAQNAILLFLLVKFNFCRKKSVTKFRCVKTSSGEVVAISFPYLMVQRWIAGRRSHLPKICAQSDPPSENADFDRFRLIVPQP